MSIPEVLLIIREDNRRESNRFLVALQSDALAAFAVWDKEAGRRLEHFRKLLTERLDPPKPAQPQDLGKVFAAWGAQIDT
jgi:hypothetical protein